MRTEFRLIEFSVRNKIGSVT